MRADRNFMLFTEPLSFKSNINPDQCLELLKENTDQYDLKYWFRFSGLGKPFVCSFDKNEIRLYKRYINPYTQTTLFYWGKISPEGRGTKIVGHFGYGPIRSHLLT